MRILLTRGDRQNSRMAELLQNLNHDIKLLNLPLIEYCDVSFAPKIIDQYQHLIITSNYCANLVATAPTLQNSLKGKYLWVVGHSSASLLGAYKSYISYVASNVRDLIGNIPAALYSKMLYLSADNISQSLPVEIHRQIIYKTTYKTSLSYQEEQDLTIGIDRILLYSQNSTKTLINLFTKYGLLAILGDSKVIAISKKIAELIQPYCREVLWPTIASNEEMLKLLQSVLRYQDAANATNRLENRAQNSDN